MKRNQPGHASPPACHEDMTQRLLARRMHFETVADEAFESAWAGVRTLSQPFKFELDLLREPSGLWRDFFVSTAYRPLDVPTLLLEDLGAPTGHDRDKAEHALFLASALEATSVLISELVLGGECNYSYEHTLLSAGLIAQEQWQLAEVARRPASIKECAIAHWVEHGDAMLAHRLQRINRTAPFSPHEIPIMGRRWAPLKSAVICAADYADGNDILDALCPLLDEAAALFQLGREMSSISRDLSRGHCTYPVSRLLQSLSGSIDMNTAPNADRVLLAALVTTTLPDLAAEGKQRVIALLKAVENLGLHNVCLAMTPLAGPFDAMAGLYANQAESEPAAEASFSVSHLPQLRQVIHAAKGYLQCDPAYHEAWEVYRWGYLNEAELICRVFPVGLVLEHRIAAGDDCKTEVDGLFELYAKNHYHYFDTMSTQPPDSDTLGLMLRLARHGGHPERCRALLDKPVRWLRENIEADGNIPVFFSAGLDAANDARYVHVAGRYCAGVQAGVLLGLLHFDADQYHDILVRGSNRLFQWFAKSSAGAIRFYDVLYGAGLMLELADGLRHARPWPAVAVAAEAAGQQAIELLRAQRGLGRVTCQDAALLWLATRFPSAAVLRDREWIELLIRTQHQEGAWDATPLYAIPGRGNLMNWYSSRLVTTAFAYHAVSSFDRTCSTTQGATTRAVAR